MFSIKVLFSERKVPRKLRDRWSFPGANEAWVMEAKSLVSLVATHWAEMQQVAKSAMGLVVDQMPQRRRIIISSSHARTLHQPGLPHAPAQHSETIQQ